MRRLLILLVGMALGAGITFVMLGSMQPPPRFPEEVVARSIELLRQGKVQRLRACYSDRAWSVAAAALPARDDADGVRRLRRWMAGVREVRVEAASYAGEDAVVETVIDHEQGARREVFHLVRSGETWLID